MQNLTGTVGENALNARHDAALVQAMLTLARRPASLDPRRSAYLGDIDGNCGNGTKRALRQFQNDQVFGDPRSNTSRNVANARPGIVSQDDATWNALVAAVPSDLSDLRVLRRSKIVYVAGTALQRDASVAQVSQLTFQPTFRTSLAALIGRIFTSTGIVCTVCAQGDRRNFQTQYELLTGRRHVTDAGPGESNHNFGQAVDLGFAGLRWLRANGTIVENESSWLHQLDPAQLANGESLFFWDMLREHGTQAGLFRGPLSDRPHLQAWSDVGIDMASRLAAHLTRVGRMRWTGRAQRYQCDLGFGGRFFEVGSAAQIWNSDATVTVATLTEARAQVQGPPLLPAARGGAPQAVQPVPATAQDVTAMKAALRADFVAADDNWETWTPR